MDVHYFAGRAACPVVIELVDNVIAVPVVRLFQLQLCAQAALSKLFAFCAEVRPERATLLAVPPVADESTS